MTTPILMPQMGESIAEGTIVRWIKKVGEAVDRDEPLFEISTDKVDAEIPSPVAGILAEIKVREGETVPVNSVVATIGDKVIVSAPAPASQPAASPAARAEAPAAAVVSGGNGDAQPVTGDPRRTRSSPLVRRIAREHNVDIAGLHGTGVGGRVTKHDILGFLEHRPASAPAVVGHVPAFKPGEAVEIVPMGVMRKKIAEHMVLSRRTSAHVHSVFEVNFARVAKVREAKKAEYERAGLKLTYLAFIVKAVADALVAFPVLNSSIDGDNIVYKKDINLGIAVALDWGLIVPVVKQANGKSVRELSRAIADLADRARGKAAEAGGRAGRHLHDHEPRHVRRAVRHADHQPAAGGDPGHRRDREARRGDRRCDRDQADGVPHDGIRPQADRRCGGRSVPVAAQGDARAVRRVVGLDGQSA